MNETFRIIPEYLTRVIRGLCGTQTIEAPAAAIDILPEITPPHHAVILNHQRTQKGVNRSRVIDLSLTGEGFSGTDPVDAEKLLAEIRQLAGYAKGAPVKKPRYR